MTRELTPDFSKTEVRAGTNKMRCLFASRIFEWKICSMTLLAIAASKLHKSTEYKQIIVDVIHLYMGDIANLFIYSD